MVTKQNEVGALLFGPACRLNRPITEAVFKLSNEESGEEAVGRVDGNAFSDAKRDNSLMPRGQSFEHTVDEFSILLPRNHAEAASLRQQMR
jgi:hypothetical protein